MYIDICVCVVCVWHRLDIQCDENEALKVALETTLKAKEEDIKMYMDMIEETKTIFIQGIQQVRKNNPRAWISSILQLIMPPDVK